MSDSKIHVLFATPMMDRGGPDRVLFELLCGLDRSRFAPSLMVSQPTGHYLSRVPADVPVEILGREHSLGTRYPFLRALRFVRRTTPDVVFATLRMITTLGLIAPALPRRTRLVLRPATPVVADFKALVKLSRVKHRIGRHVVLAALRKADAVVCQSKSMKAELGALFGSSSRLHVVGNPIDVREVMRAASAVTVKLRGRPALVSVGRLVPLKGYDILLRAIAALRQRHPHLHLTIIGDGPDRRSLEALASELGLADTVTFAGYVPEPLPYVRAAELFVLASHYDAFANAALEALACGTPVVLTDCPGANSELVTNGINGQLVPSVDPAAVTRSIETAIAELGSYDRADIQADCDRRYASGRIVTAYERVLASVAEPREESRG